MHTRSKRYMRRQQARIKAQRRRPLKAHFGFENRLAGQISLGLTKARLGFALNECQPSAALRLAASFGSGINLERRH